MTRLIVMLTSTGKCLQLRRAEVNRSHHSNAQVWLQFMYDGGIHSRLVTAVGKPQDLLVERHHVQNCLVLAPSANRGFLTDILRKAAPPEPLREISVGRVCDELRRC